MDIVEVRFKIKNDDDEEEQLNLIYSLLGAYRQNGQIICWGRLLSNIA